MIRKGHICIALATAAGALPTTADAAVRFERDTYVAKAGQPLSVHVVTSSGGRCDLVTRRVRGWVTSSGPSRVTFTWTPAKRARKGRYRLTITCGQEVARAVVRLRGKRRGRRSLAGGPVAVTSTPLSAPGPAGSAPAASGPAGPAPAGPSLPVAPGPSISPSPMTEADARAAAEERWRASAEGFASSFRSGQCTDWATRKRMDIVQRVSIALWTREYLGDPSFDNDWVAHRWDDNARAGGLEVGTIPKANAIVVFEPGALGAAGGTGHVGYVEEVLADGSFRITEMNAGGGVGVQTERVIPPSLPEGVSFVY